MKSIEVVQVSLLLTLYIFHTFFCFYYIDIILVSLLLTLNIFNNTELINVVLLFLFWTDIYPVAMTTEYQEEMFLMAKKTSFQYLHLADRAQNFNSWRVNETILPPVHLVAKIWIAGE